MKKIRLSKKFWDAIELLPVILPSSVLSFGVVAVILLLFGRLDTILVWPLGLSAAVLSSWLIVNKSSGIALPGSSKERKIVGLSVIAIVIGWTIFNSVYTAQNIYVYRDPAIYNVTAQWLVNHNNLEIPGSNVFGTDPDILPDTASFGTLPSTGDRLYAQAPHLFATLLAMVGRIGGSSLMLHSNVVFGGLALLALFAVSRLFMRPRWALLVVSVLAVSLPMMYFSRDSYSEPLTLMLIFNALALVGLAQKKNSKLLWLFAGIAAGSSVLARIDTYIVVASFLVFAFIVLILSLRTERIKQLLYMTAFTLGMAIVSVLGYIDLRLLSARYLHDLQSEFNGQIIVIALVILVGCITVYLSWHTNILSWVKDHTSRWMPLVGVLLVIIFTLFLASRPLWYEGHDSFDNPLVRGMQSSMGDAVDGTRSYSEYSLYWVAWYTGPVLAIFSLLGAAGIMFRVLKDRSNIIYLPLLLVVALTSILYFNLPKITPDQIWASRRFLPIILPGLAVFGGLAISQVLGRLRKNKKIITILTIVLILTPPLFISYPFLQTRINTPELSQVYKVCDTLPPNAALLLLGSNGINMTQTFKSYCNIPVERARDPKDIVLKDVARSAYSDGYVPYVLMLAPDLAYLGKDSEKLTLISTVSYKELIRSLDHPPRRTVDSNSTVYMSKLSETGELEGVKEQ